MVALVNLLSGHTMGQIFLGNLHHALTQTPAHIDKSALQMLWDEARRTLAPGSSAPEARSHLFQLLYTPAFLNLRFKRPISAFPPFLVHTSATPFDLTEDPNKGVIDQIKLASQIPRAGRDPMDWTPDECEELAQCLMNPAYWRMSSYAARYDIFWATPEGAYTTVDADGLRDAQGLVHIGHDTPLLQLTFACDAAFPLQVSQPTAVEATYHKRFKARSTSPAPDATAANLEPLRQTGSLSNGAIEVTLSSIPKDRLVSARYAGHTSTWPEPHGDSTDPIHIAESDAHFCDLLLNGALDDIRRELTAWLEP